MGDDWKQRIRDPVHGLIVFGGRDDHGNETDRIAWRLLDTKEFQRLRRIRQLGFADLVYPGATHTRFAHSIGVYHVARRLVDVIARQRGARHDPGRARVALLAALLHDVGHGPFSHAFESAAEAMGLKKRHEDWSAEIVQGDTEVNRVLREADRQLPAQVGALLKEEEPKDIYSAVVSSQFDADRIDYIQRDRMMTGVQFGHVDIDWLLDCLEVGSVTIGEPGNDVAVPCLYLGAKGLAIAEEYLVARVRLYWTVYMHKTTRSAEKMLESLLEAASSSLSGTHLARQEPVLRYFTSNAPSLDAYLRLDDGTMWAALEEYTDCRQPRIAELAARLRHRNLYKCLDIGSRDRGRGNLYLRFRHALKECNGAWLDGLLFDESEVKSYTWYDFNDASALSKVLVKVNSEMDEPQDIVEESYIVRALHEGRLGRRVQRVYAPDQDKAKKLEQILKEVRT